MTLAAGFGTPVRWPGPMQPLGALEAEGSQNQIFNSQTPSPPPLSSNIDRNEFWEFGAFFWAVSLSLSLSLSPKT